MKTAARYVHDARARRDFAAALEDIKAGLGYWRLWTALAADDLRQRYRRTAFGALWLTISYAVFVLAITFIFSAIAPVERSWFAVYVAVGYLAWLFINSSVVDGCDVFINCENWISGTKLPFSIFVFQSIWREVMTFGYSLIVAGIVIIVVGHPLSWVALTAIPAFMLFMLNAAFVHFLLGVIVTRYRDASQIIQTAMRVLFFLTPLIWTPEQVGNISVYLFWNPFTYFVDIFRAPIVDGVLPVFSWLVALGITGVMSLGAFVAFAHFRRRIAFWF